MNLIRPYVKIVDLANTNALVAIYEPNPFRSDALYNTLKQSGKKVGQKIDLSDCTFDDQWCWVYYDWCGNPIGLGSEVPEGRLTYTLKPEDFDTDWLGYDNVVRYCEYLNKEPNIEMKKEWYRKYGQLNN